MDKAMAFVMDHPFMTAVIVIPLFMIIKKVLSSGEDKKTLGSQESIVEEEKPEMTKIIIMAQSGRVIEEFTVETDSIEYDSSDGIYIEFDGADGERVTYMLGTFSVKMIDL